MKARVSSRMLLTTVTFAVVWSLVSGATLSGLSLLLTVFAPANADLWPVGLLMGALVYPPPAAITGLLLAMYSRRIPTGRAWLGYAAVTGAALTLASLLIVFRSIFTEGPLNVGLYVVAGLTACSLPGALAAAAVTRRLRPLPPLMEMVGVGEATA